VPYRIGEVAERANVPEDFVRQLIDLGALPGEEAGLGLPEVRRSRLLHSWAAAGLSVETILALVDRGAALGVRFVGSCVVRVAAGTRRWGRRGRARTRKPALALCTFDPLRLGLPTFRPTSPVLAPERMLVGP
jgi:hypothetical protein